MHLRIPDALQWSKRREHGKDDRPPTQPSRNAANPLGQRRSGRRRRRRKLLFLSAPDGQVGPPAPLSAQAMVMPGFGQDPQSIRCPNCRAGVITVTTRSPSVMAWVACLLLACLGCFCGCCLLPLIMDNCQEVQHYCPRCNAFCGRYRP